ncbi:helix-turn-helix domain-containing protein [Escherichia coli]|nr:helix-turn-helix domain-containing protein [Escherichia coli]EHU5252153.1 helix-turn-helix domain-containing protein [Salmonella enterica subsp. enterica serovar Havana]EKH5290732.1 helix-turn-helix domain-containing protein [Escherichia coli O76]EED1239617.1 helix-turn-helix domain-containing protein [Escherichia coli]EEQ2995838.1 helix-turn-helix domain-containing protein [Escherichia coli]EER0423634.1 helix-turn-helix domain-containing protein [Escherichia coli]
MFSYCFVITLRAFCISFYNEDVYFHKDEVLLIKKNDISCFMNSCEGYVRFIDIPSQFVSDYLYIRLSNADAFRKTNRKNRFFRKKAYGTVLKSLISLIDEHGNTHIYESVLFVLLDYLNEKKQLLPVLLGGLNNFSLRVEAIIASELAKKWYLSDVASMLCISSSQLKRKLHSEGTSFSRIVTDVRMKKAIGLMRCGMDNIYVVSRVCGYNSLSYFIQSFSKYYSITPWQWLKQHRYKYIADDR